MSAGHDDRTSPLGRAPPGKRGSVSSTKGKLIDIRPKGAVVLVATVDPTEFKRKQHAQAQKNQRDRMKAALDRIAQIMEGGGVHTGTTSGTKVELLEAAIGYIQRLQGQIEEMRGATTRPSDTSDGAFSPK
ncbi:hypothetical protein BJX63DRAFT_438478 [Aspergillus granulosus]|uniref:BHLH domain-containing protein n=1 Tax=Aspergillus granulosus TaxID=176169 RepID=A0ABR4GTL2_9EURO